MKTQHKKMRSRNWVIISMLFILILSLGCEKTRIKKNYTGVFKFISYRESTSGYNSPFPPYYDTTVTIGFISYLDDDMIRIAIDIDSFDVVIDKHGNFQQPSSNSLNTDYHKSTTINGSFSNSDELYFDYNYSIFFNGNSAEEYRRIYGFRID